MPKRNLTLYEGIELVSLQKKTDEEIINFILNKFNQYCEKLTDNDLLHVIYTLGGKIKSMDKEKREKKYSSFNNQSIEEYFRLQINRIIEEQTNAPINQDKNIENYCKYLPEFNK